MITKQLYFNVSPMIVSDHIRRILQLFLPTSFPFFHFNSTYSTLKTQIIYLHRAMSLDYLSLYLISSHTSARNGSGLNGKTLSILIAKHLKLFLILFDICWMTCQKVHSSRRSDWNMIWISVYMHGTIPNDFCNEIRITVIYLTRTLEN